MSYSTIYLDLGLNQIGDDGARNLAETLKHKQTSIVTLSLGSNNIGDDGAIALSEALKVNEKVTSMDLFGNAIEKDGVTVLKDALDYNNTLSYIGDSLVGDSQVEFLMPIVLKKHCK